MPAKKWSISTLFMQKGSKNIFVSSAAAMAKYGNELQLEN
jgi:hypothetical protein